MTAAMVEQNLLISRALVAIFSDPFLSEHLAFRGGTALHKLYMHSQPRYFEDIDLVQIHPEPINEIMNHLRDTLAFCLDHTGACIIITHSVMNGGGKPSHQAADGGRGEKGHPQQGRERLARLGQGCKAR